MAIRHADRATRKRQGMNRLLAGSRASVLLGLALLVNGCGTVTDLKDGLLGGPQGPQPGQPGFVEGFLGGVAADEPRAAAAGRDVLSAGGNAADAAVAVGMTLAVSLPSRAGLGAGGACLAYAADRKSVNGGVPEAILFTPVTPATGATGDRPAAVPMLARGLFQLHARYGSRPFETLILPAEQLARFGMNVPRALARDLSLVATPLFADPGARQAFGRDGVPLKEGQAFQQPDLAATLSQLRVAGVGDFYQGALAQRIAEASVRIGGPLRVSDLRGALPGVAPPLFATDKADRIAFLPPPADGGLAADAAFRVLQGNPNDGQGAAARSLAAAARWRAGGVTPEAVLAATDLPASGLPPLPASTSFVTMDRDGNAVMCALTMNNLFGTGRVLQGLGFMPAVSPAVVPAPLLAAGMAWNDDRHAFRAGVAASGQAGAPVAVASALMNALRTGQPMPVPVPDPGRANVVACGRYLPDNPNSCAAATDPREPGLAFGGTQ